MNCLIIADSLAAQRPDNINNDKTGLGNIEIGIKHNFYNKNFKFHYFMKHSLF